MCFSVHCSHPETGAHTGGYVALATRFWARLRSNFKRASSSLSIHHSFCFSFVAWSEHSERIDKPLVDGVDYAFCKEVLCHNNMS